MCGTGWPCTTETARTMVSTLYDHCSRTRCVHHRTRNDEVRYLAHVGLDGFGRDAHLQQTKGAVVQVHACHPGGEEERKRVSSSTSARPGNGPEPFSSELKKRPLK